MQATIAVSRSALAKSYALSRRKRLLDIVLALLGLLPASILAPFVALAIKLTTRGPVFYCQDRVGLGGKTFRVIKLRTMRVDAERSGQAIWSSESDDRVTRVGRFLRRTHIDEVPQLWNILKGEMSVVGPRPERPELMPGLEQAIPGFADRIRVKPGLTGLAQVAQGYTRDVDACRVKLAFDRKYIAESSLAIDIQIVAKTAGRLLARARA